jgi:hypothetical protein
LETFKKRLRQNLRETFLQIILKIYFSEMFSDIRGAFIDDVEAEESN